MGIFVPIKDGSIGSEKLKGDAVPLGVGQTWNNVTGSRVAGVTYTNSTGRAMVLHVLGAGASATRDIIISRNGNLAARYNATTTSAAVTTIINNGDTYSVAATGGFTLWEELS